ncbi:putative cell division cycle protein [Podospora australis]|uniref:Cell division cycle protein n=1 Tax=Podospora australis TaxID=1536484 RepID=A0AAN6X1G1_9PEZI|nr:putative cell division cycle protein [Podospora australis]
MPAIPENPAQAQSAEDEPLRFPPVTAEHIKNCSYDAWFPKYRASCIRSKIIPLTPDFISYLHEDGIILADSDSPNDEDDNDDDDWEPEYTSEVFPPPRRQPGDEDLSDSDSDSEDSPPRLPPNQRFPDLHNEITAAITELGGEVAPKLNWSSPKDAAWISPHINTMKCTSANDIYLLLKSSSFASHDLNHAFDDTVPATSSTPHPPSFQPVLVLRSYFNLLPSLEFRCFVKDRNLIAITQRDVNYYPFLRSLRPHIIKRVKELFTRRLKFTFPDACFVFDVYLPDDSDEDDETEDRLSDARLIDINPWAPRTDSLLFDWSELLEKKVARPVLGRALSEQEQADQLAAMGSSDDDEEEEDFEEDAPELRLVEKEDSRAYNFSSSAYSAHKLPKEVVDASMAGEGGMSEFMRRWRDMTEGRR